MRASQCRVAALSGPSGRMTALAVVHVCRKLLQSEANAHACRLITNLSAHLPVRPLAHTRAQPGRAGSLLHEDCSSGGAPLLVPVSGAVFQNAVERNAWRAAAASGDGEHVTAGVAAQSVHRLYVWSSAYAKLEKILEGKLHCTVSCCCIFVSVKRASPKTRHLPTPCAGPRKESITDLAWHPSRSQMVTISGNGRVYIWAQLYSENWSAFAPDFQACGGHVPVITLPQTCTARDMYCQGHVLLLPRPVCDLAQAHTHPHQSSSILAHAQTGAGGECGIR